MKRTKSSVRFDPYYKVQWFDHNVLAWHDVQKSYTNPDEALAHFITGKQCRVMEITMRGRRPLTIIDLQS
jgi:hypothetical protein